MNGVIYVNYNYNKIIANNYNYNYNQITIMT